MRNPVVTGVTTQRPCRLLTLDRCVSRSPWRIGVPFQALARNGFPTEILGATVDIDQFQDTDLLVLHNPATESHVRLVHAARQRGARVIIDLDDLLLPDYLPLDTEFGRWWHPRHVHQESASKLAPGGDVFLNLRECIRAAHALTVATETLADLYREIHPRLHVLPNCYDDSNPLWDVVPPARTTVNIGFLGTEHHRPNLDLLTGAIEPVLERHSEVRIVEAGEGNLFARIDAPAARFIHLGWIPFEVFPLVLHQMDIVLAPLVDEPFMRCKSNIRCMTAGLVGAPVVASPVGPYAGYVKHGVNGWFATEPAEWTSYLEQLVVDREQRVQMGEANRLLARRYALSINLHRWSEVYAAVLDRSCRA